MDCVTELALRRAGAGSLSEFQSREGIAATGEMDARTREALAPYALGYQIVRVRRGDTFYHLAREYGTTAAAVAASPVSVIFVFAVSVSAASASVWRVNAVPTVSSCDTVISDALVSSFV